MPVTVSHAPAIRRSGQNCVRKIWIDLDNSPHVPFFVPIIEELEKRGYSILLTARDCAQVFDLVDLHNLQCRRIGRHYGKSKIVKLGGLFLRSLQLLPTIAGSKCNLALSHGSRAQLMVAVGLGIPSLSIDDYEFSRGYAYIHPTWLMCPEVIPESALDSDRGRLLKYPGVKEDVYVPRFVPDPRIKEQLKLKPEDLVVTLRPPADDAHYRSPASDTLFVAVVNVLGSITNVKVILLPRRETQAAFVQKTWPQLFASGRAIIPDRVVDGLNLIWYSDLVISGGGTMNREAAALGVPVYSIFRGKIGAVDRDLAQQGRLTMIENTYDIRTKIHFTKRNRDTVLKENRSALRVIVNHIVAVLESKCPATQPSTR